ncbi:MAG: hypothetical protein CL526_01920 [Aequorivita sp.]|nr:hypothetical protein [Aequorivita sp.]|tara:strand:- start:400 stop:630 length:231 start_codon:yes stop_codon:yes gene_type:complete
MGGILKNKMRYFLLTLALAPTLALAAAPQKRDFRPLLPNNTIKKQELELPTWDDSDTHRAPDASLFPTRDKPAVSR